MKVIGDENVNLKADIEWAQKHGWEWDGESFVPEEFIRVIRNPMDKESGWCVWLTALGATQMDAPFASVRAALRVAEAVRRQRHLCPDEMNCAEEPRGE